MEVLLAQPTVELTERVRREPGLLLELEPGPREPGLLLALEPGQREPERQVVELPEPDLPVPVPPELARDSPGLQALPWQHPVEPHLWPLPERLHARRRQPRLLHALASLPLPPDLPKALQQTAHHQ